ncbi:MAG: hypothetical protein L0Z53_02260, partial [Acidobacteriales bacterium]|nr:hypothetical protein [Terriglobales bacterium]
MTIAQSNTAAGDPLPMMRRYGNRAANTRSRIFRLRQLRKTKGLERNIIIEVGIMPQHTPAHVHIKGGGAETKVGKNGRPLEGSPKLTAEQEAFVEKFHKE